MSRSGYSDECGTWDLIRWRGQVASAIRGRRGQAFLRDLLEALDAMPVKRLIDYELESDGEYCTLGVLGARRGLDMAKIDADDRTQVAAAFGIAQQLAAEIEFMNDDYWLGEIPEARWARMREWVASQISEDAAMSRSQ